MIAPESKDLVKASFFKHMRGEDVAPFEFSLVTKEGEKIEVILSTNLIRYEGEVAILGILTDITERKQMEEEIQHSLIDWKAILPSFFRSITS